MDEPGPDLDQKKTYKRRNVTVSTEKKSHASVPAAWARMKSRHRSLERRGAGPRPARFRIRRIRREPAHDPAECRPGDASAVVARWLLVCLGTERHDPAQPGNEIGGVAHEPA
jgi:hypothetical protein